MRICWTGLRCLFLGMVLIANPSYAIELEVFRHLPPSLLKLYKTYPSYHQLFRDYANKQGFQRPIENLATVIHELIHVDSAAHQGFFIDGIYYEPYVRKDAWPNLNNEQIGPLLLARERSVISQNYALNTPNNHLGNLVDEINAYSHVLPFVCRNEHESTEKQITNLVGFLMLSEGYLRTLRTALPVEYQRFVAQKEAKGVFILVVQRAWKVLRECGVPESAIPVQESSYFMGVSGR